MTRSPSGVDQAADGEILTPVDVMVAGDTAQWSDAARLLFAYHRETAVEVGAKEPGRPQDVWLPVRQEAMDPSSELSTYLIAYDRGRPAGGVALVAHDGLSIMLKRCYVWPQWRGRGVAGALVTAAMDVAAERGATRLVLDVLPSRQGAIMAWRRMGFVDAAPWGDASMAYFERPLTGDPPRAWLGLQHGEVALRESDRRWTSVFDHQAEVLGRALGDRVAAIEHVGSTAVADLVAKPIVDIAVRLAAGVDGDGVIGAIAGHGYEFRGDKGVVGGLLFVLNDRPHRRIAHVHVVRQGDDQWSRYLEVRDRLRADARARGAYSALKVDLARRFPSDRAAYTTAKASFLQALLREDRC